MPADIPVPEEVNGVCGPQWYVAHTHVHAEAKAASHLLRQGFPVYLPRYLKRRRHARRTELVAAPLFPRYVFVSVDRTRDRWRSIRSTIGVAHLVSHGDEPAVLPADVIDRLKAREDGEGFIRLDPAPKFAPGDRVQVTEGVFDACYGLYEGMADAMRVTILLELLGRKVRVVLGAEAVAAA